MEWKKLILFSWKMPQIEFIKKLLFFQISSSLNPQKILSTPPLWSLATLGLPQHLNQNLDRVEQSKHSIISERTICFFKRSRREVRNTWMRCLTGKITTEKMKFFSFPICHIRQKFTTKHNREKYIETNKS